MIGKKGLIVLSSASVLLLGALTPAEAGEVSQQALIEKLQLVKNQSLASKPKSESKLVADSQPLPDLQPKTEPEFAPVVSLEDRSKSDRLLDEDTSLEQVTNVSQLRDVEPTDWAYTALTNLVERYGCIAGYPDGTFRGNRAMTRYEFATALNSCIDKILQQPALAGANGEFANKQDLVQIQKLNEEFATELAVLKGRIDNLEVRNAELASQQFSTTAIIGGEAIFAISTATGGDPPGTGNANTTFNHLTRLQLVSSFSGKDRLRMELSAGNFERFGFGNPNVLNTNTALLSFQAETNNSIALSMLEYRFPAFGDRVVFTLRPVGFSLSSVLSANSPYFDTGRGAISRFAELNPVFRIGNLDAGVGMDWLVSNRARIQIAYGASNGSNPGNGFFLGEGSHATGIQFVLLPADNVLTGITYVYGYSPDGRLNTFTGSAIADASGFINQSSNIHAVSGTLQWRISPKFTFSTWGGLVGTYAATTDAFAVSTNFMFALGISDLFQEGSLLGLMFGQPPKLAKVGDFSVASGLGEDATSFHIEAFYRFRLNDNIFITPGFFIVTNPGNIKENNDIFVGTIRTTLRF